MVPGKINRKLSAPGLALQDGKKVQNSKAFGFPKREQDEWSLLYKKSERCPETLAGLSSEGLFLPKPVSRDWGR